MTVAALYVNELKECREDLFPSSKEGRPRRSIKCDATLVSARPGRSNQSCSKVSDLPRCALFKVALHLFVGRSDPFSKEGNAAFKPLNSFTCSMSTGFRKQRNSGGPRPPLQSK